MKDILGVEWRTGRQTVGVVAVKIDHGFWCAYIGPAKGDNEEYDIADIRSWGARLNLMEAMAFFPHLDPTQYGKE